LISVTKRAGLSVALVVLIGFEALLLSVFLPARWRDAHNHQVFGSLSEARKDAFDTHPILDQETKRGLEEDLPLRIVLYTAYGLLVTGNSFLLPATWRAFRKGSQNPATSPN
jgi:hypothetical protein